MNIVSVVDPVDGSVYISEPMDDFEYSVYNNDEYYKTSLMELGREAKRQISNTTNCPPSFQKVDENTFAVASNNKEHCSPENVEIGENTEDNLSSTFEKEMWTANATKLFLSKYQELFPKVGEVFSLRSKKMMWRKIRESLQEKGYKFSAIQVENRWKTLDRSFKAKVLNNKNTGRSRANCAFDRELEEIHKKRKAIFPEFVIGRESKGKKGSTLLKEAGLSQEEDDSVIGVHNDDIADPPCPSTNNCAASLRSLTATLPQTLNKNRSILSEIQELRKQKEEHFNKKMELEERKMQLEEKKLEAFNKRTAAIIEKNNLVQKCIRE